MGYAQEQITPYNTEESKKEQVEQMFDNIAPAYDPLNHLLSLGIDRHWRRTAIEWLKPFHPEHILDIATGTGDFAILAGKELAPRELIGVDISEGMMQVARQKVEKAGLSDHIRFQQADSLNLPFPDESFDAVLIAFGVRNFANLDASLNEIHRVLATGGHLVILELSTPISSPMKQLFGIYSKCVLPSLGRLISKDHNAYTYLPETIKAFPQGEIMQDIIGKAGFGTVTFRRLTMGICTLYMATK